MIRELINSLDPTEKRYFLKRFSKDTQIIKVYKAIVSLESDKNDDLKKILGKAPYFSLINVLKKQLHEEILIALRDYHKDNHVDFQFRNELTNIQILIYKKLFNQAKKKVTLLKKKLNKHDNFVNHQDLLSIELTLLQQFQKEGKYQESMDRISKEYAMAIQGQDTFLEQKIQYFQLQNILNNKTDSLSVAKFNLSSEKVHSKFPSSIYFNTLSNILLKIERKKYGNAIPYAETLTLFQEKYPHELKKNVSQFIDVQFLCGYVYLLNNEIATAKNHISIIEALKTKGNYLPVKQDERVLYLKLVQQLVQNKTNNITELYTFWFSKKIAFTRIYFEKTTELLSILACKAKDYKLANKINTDILIMSSKERDQIVLKRSLLRDCFISSTKEDSDLFEYKLDGLKRKRKFWHQKEIELLKSITKPKDSKILQKWCNEIY